MTLETQQSKTLYWSKTGIWLNSPYDNEILAAIKNSIETQDILRREMKVIYKIKCVYCGDEVERTKRWPRASCETCKQEIMVKYQYLYRHKLINKRRVLKKKK